MNAERLLKLAEHLESGKLGHKAFNFKHWNADEQGEELYQGGCGYCGCAIGECPFAFPDEWIFDAGIPKLSGSECWFVQTDANEFFEIKWQEFKHLFQPEKQQPEIYGGQFLNGCATPVAVASNIRAFVAKKQEAA